MKESARHPGSAQNLPEAANHQEATNDGARLRHESWQFLSDEEKLYFARLYFELLDSDKRDEVWDSCSPEDRFAILRQEHYWSVVDDKARDESLGFTKAKDSLDQGAYFRLLTSDARKNEAWDLLPALTANNWYSLWGAESPDDANEILTERRPYFHGIALEEWRARIGRRDAGKGEIWEALNNDNRLKYFNFFTSFCDSDQKSEVWRRLNDEEKALLVAREPRWWTTFMLFGSADGLHDNERDEAWSFLSNKAKDDVLVESAFKISAAQRDEAWASASREAKVAVFTYDSRVLLNDEQKREAWSLMTRGEKEFAAAYMGITPEETSLFQG